MKQLILPYAMYICGPAWMVFGFIGENCGNREVALKDYLKASIH
ncbi:MAG: hypothetical protein AB1426_06315 [Bacillota bacterium]